MKPPLLWLFAALEPSRLCGSLSMFYSIPNPYNVRRTQTGASLLPVLLANGLW
jgi:hypothetical protein